MRSEELEDMCATMGALELGIIPPNQCIDEAMARLTKSEARRLTRKYRKVMRRVRKKWGLDPRDNLPISHERRLVRLYCIHVGKGLIRGTR